MSKKTARKSALSGMLGAIPLIIKDFPRQAKKPVDKSIIFLVVLLTCFGFLMIWSASMYNAKLDTGDEFYYVAKQLEYAVVGFILMWIISCVNYKYLREFSGFMMVVIFIMLVLVLLQPETEAVKGATRGLSLLGITILPSEFAKVAVIVFMANEIEKRADILSSFKGFVILVAFMAVLAVTIYKQPALSTAIIVAGVIIGMYFMGGGNLGYITLMGLSAVSAVVVFIMSSEWRMKRVLAYLDPWSDLHGSGWQPAQSLMALGSGGIFGQGIGNGKAKLMFLPEPQNDYIFSIIGEELGLIGCTAVVLVYFLLIFKLIRIALGAKDAFGRMLASGMALLLGVQVFLNIAVVTNLIPATGVMLPFISSGGSSLISLMIGMGIVLNVSRNSGQVKV